MYAQDPVHSTINTNNGLPSNTVYNILQDADGYIWLGHDKGLSKYDGSSYTHYKTTIQQGKSVSNLMEINKAIWCQDFSGNFYYVYNDTLTKSTSISSNGVYASASLLYGNTIIVNNGNGMKQYNTSTKVYKADTIYRNSMQAACAAQDNLYFFCNTNLMRYNGTSYAIEQSFNKVIPIFYFLIKLQNGLLGFTRNAKEATYEIVNNTITPIPLLPPGQLVQDVSIIQDEIWISTTTGAYCFTLQLVPKYGGHCFFKSNSITKIIKDKENNYWFGTLNDGAYLVPDINSMLYAYNNKAITALSNYADNTQLLIGTATNEVLTFNVVQKTFYKKYKADRQHEILDLKYDTTTRNAYICSDKVYQIATNNSITEINLGGKNIAFINNNSIAIAFSNGIALYNNTNESGVTKQVPFVGPIYFKEATYALLVNARGRAVYYNVASEQLYTATSIGISQYSISKGIVPITYNNKPIYASCFTMLNGVLYAGTFSDGLYAINNTTVTHLNAANATLSSSVSKLTTNGDNIWLVSDGCVQKYNVITKQVVVYNTADGLPKAEIKDILVQNGNVYVATTVGLIVFDELKNTVNSTAPTILINKITANGKLINKTDDIVLKSYENNIQVNLSVIAYKGAAYTTVQYKINNGTWQTLEASAKYIQLASLASGKYTIELRAINEDGIQAKDNTILRFSINTPIYKRVWFILFCIAIVLALMYSYFKSRLYNEKKRNELMEEKILLEQELQQSMLTSIKSQMNPHFLFNALNTIQSYIYTNDKKLASEYLGKFSDLTRMILDMSNKNTVTLAEELKALELYLQLEMLRFEDKLQYHIIVQPSITTETLSIPSMLIQPYVENAIKHGLMHLKGVGTITITITQHNDVIIISIDDNGVGRQASEIINNQRHKGHNSFATKANEKRLDILNKGYNNNIALHIQDKVDQYRNALGTTVTINIPLLKPKPNFLN